MGCIRRGKANHAKDGNWIHGSPPHGTVRVLASRLPELPDGESPAEEESPILVGWTPEARAKRWVGVILKKGEPAAGPVVLAGDPATLPDWTVAAELYLAGHSLKSIGKQMYDKGRRGTRGGRLSHSFVKNLTSSPLMGQLEYTETTASGDRVIHKIDLAWDPLVDPDLWDQVQDRIAHSTGTRKRKESFPLRPFCMHCGAPYWGGTITKRDDQKFRVYRHAPVDSRDDADMYARYVAADCRRYHVHADVLEGSLARLIGAERGSPEFEARLRARMVDDQGYLKESEREIARLRRELDEIRQKQEKLAVRLTDLSFPEDILDTFRQTAHELSNRREDVEKQLRRAERAREVSSEAWNTARRVIQETRNISQSWEHLDPGERTLVFQHWVVVVGLAVEKIPGRVRGHPVTAVAYLAPSPDSPKLLPLAPDLASSSSSSTQESSSEAAASDNVPSAAVPPTRPSAQAACPRTSASGSVSARDSTGTASVTPQLPIATQTLRASPALPARRIAEPREKESHASGSSATSRSSKREGASVPGCAEGAPGSSSTPIGGSPGPRAAYDASEATLENLRLNGHTSWDIYRLDTYRVWLTGGQYKQ